MLKFSDQLIKAQLIRRYKRFLADVNLEDGECTTAHCPNTGSMKTCGDAGDTVYLSYHDSPKRKLKYTWELTETAEGYIGVNTAMPNRIVEWAIASGLIPELVGYESIRREVKYGKNSRIDLLLERENEKCYVEVKNCTLLGEDSILFPDAVTQRGTKHLQELSALRRQGIRTVMFYLVNRPEKEYFQLAKDIDPVYVKTAKQAVEKGLEILVYRAKTSLVGVEIGEAVPLVW